MTAMTSAAVSPAGPLSGDESDLIDAWWQAANYLSVGQIYLLANPCCASRCGPSTSSLGC